MMVSDVIDNEVKFARETFCKFARETLEKNNISVKPCFDYQIGDAFYIWIVASFWLYFEYY